MPLDEENKVILNTNIDSKDINYLFQELFNQEYTDKVYESIKKRYILAQILGM